MKKPRWSKIGPFSYYWGPGHSFISAWLTRFPNSQFGWEWGSDGLGDDHPYIVLRIGGLKVLGLEWDKSGFEIWFLGFWWMTW